MDEIENLMYLLLGTQQGRDWFEDFLKNYRKYKLNHWEDGVRYFENSYYFKEARRLGLLPFPEDMKEVFWLPPNESFREWRNMYNLRIPSGRSGTYFVKRSPKVKPKVKRSRKTKPKVKRRL